MAQPTIATLTMNPAIDLSYEVDEIAPTKKLRTRAENLFPAGGGINVARVLARLGDNPRCVYMAGGMTGPTFEALLAEHGLAATRIAIEGSTRISTTVNESDTGEEYRFTPPGPEVTEAEWLACLEAIEDLDCDWLVASGSLPRGVPSDFYARLAVQAARGGTRVAVDCSGKPLRAAIASGKLFMAKPNQVEFEYLCGRCFLTTEGIGEAASEMVRDNGLHLLVVTLGDRGAVLAAPDGHRFCPALPLEAKSAVGAGDSFTAGMVHALAHGQELDEAFRLGMATGSAAILTAGTGLALREDIERLLKQYSAC